MFNPDYNNKKPSKIDIFKGKWSHFWFNYEYTSYQSYGSGSSYTKTLKKQKIINIILVLLTLYAIMNKFI